MAWSTIFVRKPFAWLRCEGQGSCLLRKIGIPVSEGNEDFSEVGAVFRKGRGVAMREQKGKVNKKNVAYCAIRQ